MHLNREEPADIHGGWHRLQFGIMRLDCESLLKLTHSLRLPRNTVSINLSASQVL